MDKICVIIFIIHLANGHIFIVMKPSPHTIDTLIQKVPKDETDAQNNETIKTKCIVVTSEQTVTKIPHLTIENSSVRINLNEDNLKNNQTLRLRRINKDDEDFILFKVDTKNDFPSYNNQHQNYKSLQDTENNTLYTFTDQQTTSDAKKPVSFEKNNIQYNSKDNITVPEIFGNYSKNRASGNFIAHKNFTYLVPYSKFSKYSIKPTTSSIRRDKKLPEILKSSIFMKLLKRIMYPIILQKRRVTTPTPATLPNKQDNGSHVDDNNDDDDDGDGDDDDDNDSENNDAASIEDSKKYLALFKDWDKVSTDLA